MIKYEYWKPTNPHLRFTWVVARERLRFTAMGPTAGVIGWISCTQHTFTVEDVGAVQISRLEAKLRGVCFEDL